MVYATISREFNSYHRMWNESLSAAENLALFGKCANPAGHGHTYRVEVTFARAVDRQQPFVLSMQEIHRLIGGVLEPALDFADLNATLGAGFISSGENIAKSVWELVTRSFDSTARLVAVTVIETRKNSFVYRGGEPRVTVASRMI
jgi:6-pyruvoyltetrahydropterin/6-carboxytetrahydropterin synthase